MNEAVSLFTIIRVVTGTVAQLIELLLCDREVSGLIPGGVIPKTLKMVLAALRLVLSIKKVELGIRTGQVSVSSQKEGH